MNLYACPHERISPKRLFSAPCCWMDVLALVNPAPLFTAAVRTMHCAIVKIFDALYGHRASPVIAWVHQKLPEQLIMGSIRNTVHRGRHPSVKSYVIPRHQLWLHTCNLQRTGSAPAVACLGKVTRKLPVAVHGPPMAFSMRHEAYRRLCTPYKHPAHVAGEQYRVRSTRKHVQVLHVSSSQRAQSKNLDQNASPGCELRLFMSWEGRNTKYRVNTMH